VVWSIVVQDRHGDPVGDLHTPNVAAAVSALQEMQGDYHFGSQRTFAAGKVARNARDFLALQHVVVSR
jgi:hypothetical protein